MSDLQAIADRFEIEELRGAFTDASMMHDWDRFASLFTEDGAWQFVADLLDAGQPLTEVALEKPPGKKGYVMKIPVKGWRPIYIKLQLGSGQVFGRSFHHSIGNREDE